MKFKVGVISNVVIYTFTYVEAASMEEADRKVQADLDAQGWDHPIWQNTPESDFRIDWRSASKLEVDTLEIIDARLGELLDTSRPCVICKGEGKVLESHPSVPAGDGYGYTSVIKCPTCWGTGARR